jgi:hypothetical protein
MDVSSCGEAHEHWLRRIDFNPCSFSPGGQWTRADRGIPRNARRCDSEAGGTFSGVVPGPRVEVRLVLGGRATSAVGSPTTTWISGSANGAGRRDLALALLPYSFTTEPVSAKASRAAARAQNLWPGLPLRQARRRRSAWRLIFSSSAILFLTNCLRGVDGATAAGSGGVLGLVATRCARRCCLGSRGEERD